MAEHRQKLHPTDNSMNLYHDQNGPSTSKVFTVVPLLPVCLTLLLLSGLSLIGSLIGLAITAPVFLFFSPVLVPAAVLIAGTITGFLTSGAFGITGLSSFSWIANFVRRNRDSTCMSQQQQQQQQLDLNPVKWPSPDDAVNKSRGGGRIHEEAGKTQEAENKSVG